MKFYAKTYRHKNDVVVAICDESHLNKTYKEGELVLKVSDFYNGSKIEEEEAKKLLANASIINLVGENIIKIAISMDLVEKDKLIRIDGVPHAQIVFI